MLEKITQGVVEARHPKKFAQDYLMDLVNTSAENATKMIVIFAPRFGFTFAELEMVLSACRQDQNYLRVYKGGREARAILARYKDCQIGEQFKEEILGLVFEVFSNHMDGVVIEEPALSVSDNSSDDAEPSGMKL
jgi:hypothetical protein